MGGRADAGLAPVLRLLRRDKEIAVASLDVAKQETERLRAQLQATQSALDEARQRLTEVRGACQY